MAKTNPAKEKKQQNEMNFFAEHIKMNNFKSQPFVNCRRCILNMCDEFYTFARMTNSNGYIFSFVCILQIHWCLFAGFLFSSCTEPFETRQMLRETEKEERSNETQSFSRTRIHTITKETNCVYDPSLRPVTGVCVVCTQCVL